MKKWKFGIIKCIDSVHFVVGFMLWLIHGASVGVTQTPKICGIYTTASCADSVTMFALCWYDAFSWYGDGAGNAVEENSSIFSLIRMC